jgi:MoaA/NifB/PqqE/SkfB family radical SAM enzyme
MKCAAFWKHANIRPGNRIYPCCRFKTPVDVFNGDIDSVLESDSYEELRRASAAGETISGCEKCYYEESIGHKSLRQEINEKYKSDTVSLEYLEIGIDNLCNMACDGCGSEFSTSWIAKEKKLYGKAENGYLDNKPITAVPGSVKKILFLGGEPLLTDKHLELLEQHSDPGSCALTYNTNASIIPNQYCLDLWTKFKSVDFIVSIDGYGDVNEKVREGSNWYKTVQFLDWCIDNSYDFEINSVIHKNNLFSILDLEAFVKSYTDRWYVNVLTFPTQLDIATLDDATLDSFLDRIQKHDIPNTNFIVSHINTARSS